MENFQYKLNITIGDFSYELDSSTNLCRKRGVSKYLDGALKLSLDSHVTPIDKIGKEVRQGILRLWKLSKDDDADKLINSLKNIKSIVDMMPITLTNGLTNEIIWNLQIGFKVHGCDIELCYDNVKNLFNLSNKTKFLYYVTLDYQYMPIKNMNDMNRAISNLELDVKFEDIMNNFSQYLENILVNHQ